MTATEDADEFVFVCPACDEELAVNDSMREALIRKGCVICGAEVGPEDFQ